VVTFSSVAGSSGGTRLEEQALEVHQHTLFKHLKNVFFSRNLCQNILKNACFWKKALKSLQRQGIRPQKSPLASKGRGLRPQTLTLLLSLIDINLSK